MTLLKYLIVVFTLKVSYVNVTRLKFLFQNRSKIYYDCLRRYFKTENTFFFSIAFINKVISNQKSSQFSSFIPFFCKYGLFFYSSPSCLHSLSFFSLTSLSFFNQVAPSSKYSLLLSLFILLTWPHHVKCL